jgi:hypothetical protein
LLLVLATAAGATYETPLPECGGCNVSRQPCVLHYGAEGVVRDKFTLEPIAGATIVVLDVQGVSGDDGSYHVEASRVTGCHQDYFYSVTATAPGYKVFSFEYYATSTFKNLTIELEPERAPNRYTVSGTVAEFPPCSGRMRGVTVRLEPLGLVTQTSNATVDGGTFAFSNVPIGDYTVRVAQGCSPLGGCWAVTPLRVDDSDVTVRICMDRVEPPPIQRRPRVRSARRARSATIRGPARRSPAGWAVDVKHVCRAPRARSWLPTPTAVTVFRVRSTQPRPRPLRRNHRTLSRPCRSARGIATMTARSASRN